jgi:DNA-binding NarL/FixJ family response regulator
MKLAGMEKKKVLSQKSKIRGSLKVTIVLADDHAIVRQGLRTLLESDPQFEVVGEAANGLEAIELVKRRKPTVLIADLMMPGLNGLETTRKVLRLKSKTRVIVLSMYRNEAYVLEALRIGAAGYIAKESGGAELFQAIREVVAGRRYLSPIISEAAKDSYSSMGTILKKASAGSPDPYDTLTARERQMLQLMVEGATNRDMGARMKTSSHAVEIYRAALMRKLGLKTRGKLILYALRRGVAPGHEAKAIKKK